MGTQGLLGHCIYQDNFVIKPAQVHSLKEGFLQSILKIEN
jgi:hypothetical protein